MGMTQEEFEAKKAADAAKGIEEKHDETKAEAKDEHMAPPDELDAQD